MEFERIIDFLHDVGKLKRLTRTGWIESGVIKAESVADHSYRTTLLSMILSDLEGLNTLNVVRIALFHDLAESRVGDLTPLEKQQTPEWEKQETIAIHEILSQLPKKQSEFYEQTWKEWREGLTPEAKLVKRADKLEMLLQAQEYIEAGEDAKKLMRFSHISINSGSNEFEKAVKRLVDKNIVKQQEQNHC